ncbi:MAG: glycosyltransferase family 2 protein, partial [Thermodesulfobium sp.]
MPAYNHEKFVQEAIKSVIDQNYDNIEFIIINDCSTDNTHSKICEMIDI